MKMVNPRWVIGWMLREPILWTMDGWGAGALGLICLHEIEFLKKSRKCIFKSD